MTYKKCKNPKEQKNWRSQNEHKKNVRKLKVSLW